MYVLNKYKLKVQCLIGKMREQEKNTVDFLVTDSFPFFY